MLILGIAANSVPCIDYDPSTLATASDCSAKKLDDVTLSWGVKITFTGDADHRKDNWLNLLADL